MSVIRAAILAAMLPTLAFAHAGGHDLRGTIMKVEKNAVVVKSTDGVSQTVPLTAATTYRVGKAAGSWKDMEVGSRVVVHIGHDGNAIEVQLPARK